MELIDAQLAALNNTI